MTPPGARAGAPVAPGASKDAAAGVRSAREAERSGRIGEARERYERGLGSLAETDPADLSAKLLRWIAWTHSTDGDADAALDVLEAAEAVAVAFGDDGYVGRLLNDIGWDGESLLVCGSAHRELENSEVALQFLHRALAVARDREDPKLIADVVLEQARAVRSVGRNRDTLRRLNEARKLFERLQARPDLASVGERLAELEAACLQIVREWGESIESKDAYTHGHCSRVARYACMLAEETGVSESDLGWFRMGALLHDVGKVSVPREILTKNGPLDDSEWAIMARHPEFGVDLLEGIEFPWNVRPMIRHHHERYDGSGYPDGLSGQSIPFEARILTIADIYDALTTTRSYRAAFSHDKTMSILRSEMGTTVDPELFRLFDDRVAPRVAPVASRVGAEQRPRAAVL